MTIELDHVIGVLAILGTWVLGWIGYHRATKTAGEAKRLAEEANAINLDQAAKKFSVTIRNDGYVSYRRKDEDVQVPTLGIRVLNENVAPFVVREIYVEVGARPGRRLENWYSHERLLAHNEGATQVISLDEKVMEELESSDTLTLFVDLVHRPAVLEIPVDSPADVIRENQKRRWRFTDLPEGVQSDKGQPPHPATFSRS